MLLENMTSSNFFGIKFTNDLKKILSKDKSLESFDGELTALADAWDIRIRGAVLYDLDHAAQNRIRSYSLSGYRDIDDRSTVRFGAARDVVTGIDTVDFQYSHDFEKVGLDLGVAAGTDHNYTFTVGLRASLQPDELKRYHLEDPKTGGLASIGGRAFVDANGNGVFDSDEKKVDGVKFRSSYNSVQEDQNDDGVAWIHGLGEAPTRISVMQESIPDIYLAPNFNYKDVIPRRGVTPVLDFPFSQMGEIEGIASCKGDGIESLPVQLLGLNDKGEMTQIDTTTTEYDGYYIFPAVKSGHYQLRFGSNGNDVTRDVELNPAKTTTATVDVSVTEKFLKQFQDDKKKNKVGKKNTDFHPDPNIMLEEKDLKPIDQNDLENLLEDYKDEKQ